MSNSSEPGQEPCPCDNLKYGPPDANGRRSIFVPETAWSDEPLPSMPRDYGLAPAHAEGGIVSSVQGVTVRPYRPQQDMQDSGPMRAAYPNQSTFLEPPRSRNPNVCYLPGPQPEQRSTSLGDSAAGGPFGSKTLSELGIVRQPDADRMDAEESDSKGGPSPIPDSEYKPEPGKLPDTKWENPAAGERVHEKSKDRYKVPKPQGPIVEAPDPAAEFAEILEDYRKRKYSTPPPEPKALPCPNSKMRYFVGTYWWSKSLAGEFWQDDSKDGDQAAKVAAKAAVEAVELDDELDVAEKDDVARTKLLQYMKDSLGWDCDPPCKLAAEVKYMRLGLSAQANIELNNDPQRNKPYYKVWLVRFFKLEVLADVYCAT